MNNTLKLSRGIIETKIKEHFRKTFDPQNTKLETSVYFEHKENARTYKFDVPYSNLNINIYNDNEIDCRCGDVEIELVLFRNNPKAKSLNAQLLDIEYELIEEFEVESYKQRQEEKYL